MNKVFLHEFDDDEFEQKVNAKCYTEWWHWTIRFCINIIIICSMLCNRAVQFNGIQGCVLRKGS